MRSRFRTTFLTLGAALAVSALAAGPALAAGAPKVETKPATPVYETYAMGKGTVNPNGAETKYFFEYGPTNSYGKKTTEVNAGSGTVSLEESSFLSTLTAGTTYHFRVVAKNSYGTTDGADEVFKTTPHALPMFSTALQGRQVSLGSFTVKSTKTTVFPLDGFADFVCSQITGSGTINSDKSGTISLKFEGCTYNSEKLENDSTGPLPFVLVYTSKEPTKQVAIAINHGGEVLLPTKVGPWTEIFYHTILAPITPLNTMSKTFTAAMTEKESRQTPSENYNEELTGMEKSLPEYTFEGVWSENAWIEGGFQLENTMKGGEKAEGKIEA